MSRIQARFMGVPEALRPSRRRDANATSRFEVVAETDTPRDLEKRPFDYRNPFPPRVLPLTEAAGGPATRPDNPYVRDDDPTAFDYYCNDNAAIGMPGGPECALVDIHGTLRSYTGAWAMGIGKDAQAPAARTRTLARGWIPVVLARTPVQGGELRMTWFSADIPEAPDVEYPFVKNGGCFQWVGGPEPRGRNLFYCARYEVYADKTASGRFEMHLGYGQAGSLCSGAYYTKPRYSPPWERLEWRRRTGGRWHLEARHAGMHFCLAVLQVQDGSFVPSPTTRIRHWPQPLGMAPKRPAQIGGLWREFAARFERIVIARLRALGRKTGGVITPTFEGFEAEPLTRLSGNPPRKHKIAGAYGIRGGCDWHNIGAVFPIGVLTPHDPLVSSSLARWRHTYIEGVFPYPSDGEYVLLHNYNGLNLSGTWLRRGDWAEAVRDLYGSLLHTSATHASAEAVNSAFRLDYGCTPHNWFSGKLVRYTRDLLAYENSEGLLHLLGGLSPAWMQPGMDVGVRNLPTDYGTLTYTARMRLDGLRMDILFRPRDDARGLVLHLPPFLRNVRVRADGRPCRPSDKGWRLNVRTRRVEATWTSGPLPDISFQRVVESYLADYQRRVALQEHGRKAGQR